MKKKFIAAAVAITLLFAVFAMNVSATYIQLYHFGGSLSNNISYDVYLSVDTQAHYYEMDAWAWGGTNVSIRLQCTVVYSDNSYDQTYSNHGSNSDNAVVYYDPSKTVAYVDMEMHIYEGSTYIDTVSDTY